MNHNTLPGSPALVGGELHITVDVWLYGTLACYGGQAGEGSFANVKMHLPEGSTMADLLARLGMRTEERGITFINGQLSAMPSLQPDLGHILRDGDRVGLFDLKSMWPFQYRHGAMLTDEMARAMDVKKDHGLHHTYSKE
jgi:sulfur carrier protein ThiS